MLDVMVDLETTGTRPDRHSIMQVAAVQFNLRTGEVFADNMFNRCMFMPPHRSWDEGTREWWAQQDPNVYARIQERMEPVKDVIDAFVNWSRPAGTLRFWSKPSHFDYSFVSSYFHDEGYDNPFGFREAENMASWIRGRYFPDPVPEVPFVMEGAAHDAIFDTLHQIKVLMWHYNNTKNQILVAAE